MDGPAVAAAAPEPKENGVAHVKEAANGKLSAAQKKKLQKKRRKQEKRVERQVPEPSIKGPGPHSNAGDHRRVVADGSWWRLRCAGRPSIPSSRRRSPMPRHR